MIEKRKSFWRNFTWKRFIIITFVWFVLNFIISYLIEFAINKEQAARYLDANEIVKKLAGAFFVGFFLTIWLDPVKKPEK